MRLVVCLLLARPINAWVTSARPAPHRLADALTVLNARGRGGAKRMPNGVAKENLPSKVCVSCGRPFTWRKKWERCWDEVTTCSKRCNAERRQRHRGAAGDDGADDDGDIAAISDDGSDDGADADARGGDARAQRKAARKQAKAARRAKREGRADAGVGAKPCDACAREVDLLVRCTTDASGAWRMVCGRCWRDVSGGVADGDAAHPHYRYGGLWKNRTSRRGATPAGGGGAPGPADEAEDDFDERLLVPAGGAAG